MPRSTNFRGSLAMVATFAGIAHSQINPLCRVTRDSLSGTGDALAISSASPVISPDGRWLLFQTSADTVVPNDTNEVDDLFLRDRSAGTVTRVNVTSAGAQTTGAISSSTLSPDGRFIAYTSSAKIVLPDPTNFRDVFVLDIVTGLVTRETFSSAGVAANAHSEVSWISSDGRYVTFTTTASNLVAGDTNGLSDVFLRDRLLGTTECLTAAGGTPVGGSGDLSDDGRYFAFTSLSALVVPNDTNLRVDAFLTDRVTQTTIRINLDPQGAQSAYPASEIEIALDSSIVIFESKDPLLVPGDVFDTNDVFSYDIASGAVTRILVGASPQPPFSCDISPDGGFLLWKSTSVTLVPGDTNSFGDVFVCDLSTLIVERRSLGCVANQGNGNLVSTCSVSAGAIHVAFVSQADNLVPDDANGEPDIFVSDRAAAPVTRPPEPSESASRSDAGALGNKLSRYPRVSDDGRAVAFSSESSNLVPNHTGTLSDIFVRDTVTQQTSCVSVDPTTNSSNGDSFSPSLSSSGQCIAFESLATNLVAGDVNGMRDVFVYDQNAGVHELISIASDSTQGTGISTSPSISADGNLVAFSSEAPNLVANDGNGMTDVFLRDRTLGTTILISHTPAGTSGNSVSWSPEIAADGQFIVFLSAATDLQTPVAQGFPTWHVFVYDVTADTLSFESLSPAGLPANGIAFAPTISADGGWIVWSSDATNLTSPATNYRQIFLRDRTNATTTLISVDSLGTPANGQCHQPRISDDATHVVYSSFANNLGGVDTNAQSDVFLCDVISNATERLSYTYGGVEAFYEPAQAPDVSADGRVIAYETTAGNAIAEDYNGFQDVLFIDRTPSAAFYCSAPRKTHECQPRIYWSGIPSRGTASGFVITATQVRAQSTGSLIYGVTGASTLPFQGGMLCVSPPFKFKRTPPAGGAALPLADCSGSFSFAFNPWMSAGIDPALIVGQQVWAQYTSRIPGGAVQAGLSLTDALAFTIEP